MGYALAEAARARDARVTLISGPTRLSPARRCDSSARARHPRNVQRGAGTVGGRFRLYWAAAVADFRPAAISRAKDQKKKAAKPSRSE